MNWTRFQLSCAMLALLGVSLSACGGAGRLTSLQASTAVLDSETGRAELGHWLRALQTRASFIMFTAHPDDEDGGTLVYETRGQGARGALFTLTRGEGGQNVMSADLYDSLGLIRTQELLKSDQYYGVDQYFSRLIDYGFSKTPEEAIEKWGHDRLLSDAVRVVRTVRPLVIVSEFLGTPVDGHGNHQVDGRLAQEAFAAAGDPDKFPEQIREGLPPWSPLKIYARLPATPLSLRGIYEAAVRSETLPAANVEIQEGKSAPGSELTYFQIAHAALGFQKSQGGEGTLPKSPFESSYHRWASRVPAGQREASFFEGIDSSLKGIASLATGETKFLEDGLAQLSDVVADSLKHYEADRSSNVAPSLAGGLRITRALIEQTCASSLVEPGKGNVLLELRTKEKQLEKALAEALDLSLRATALAQTGESVRMATPGQVLQVDAQVFNHGSGDVNAENIEIIPSDGKAWRIRSDASSRPSLQRRFSVSVPADAKFTRTYFTRPNDQQAYYDLMDQRYQNAPFEPYPLSARARLRYGGVTFELERVVEAPSRSPLLVGPPISLTVSPAAGAFPMTAKSFPFSCTIHSNGTDSKTGVVRLKLPPGWRSDPPEARFLLTRDGPDQTISFSVSPAMLQRATYTIAASANYKGREYTEGYHLAGYQDLAPYPYYRSAEYRAVAVDAAVAPGLKIAFLSGTGDDVPKALASLGQDVTTLTAGDLSSGELNAYDAIILGTRAYAVRADLKSANARLIDYVRNGGVLVVQYNLENFDHNYGPFPFTLGSNPEKVVDETAPVRLAEPGNPIFMWPNRITEADFRDWVEERGHGFLKSWDAHYVPLLETHDPGQDPQKGGLLLARYGKGFYIYDAFALYRQLPAGVPGAFRVLANLVSLGKNPAWK